MTDTDRLSQAIHAHPPQGDTLPVFINLRDGLVYLGHARTTDSAFDRMIAAGHCAEKMSHAVIKTTGEQCFVGHR